MKNSSDSMSMAGMIIGIIGLIISIFPCFGLFGSLLALVGLILSIMGYRRDKDSGAPTTLAIVGMVLSGLAILVGLLWGVFVGKVFSDVASGGDYKDKVYNNCDELLVDMEAEVKKMESLDDKGEENFEFGDLSVVMNATKNIAYLGKKIEDMGCKQDSTFKARLLELDKDFE